MIDILMALLRKEMAIVLSLVNAEVSATDINKPLSLPGLYLLLAALGKIYTAETLFLYKI